MPEDSGPLSHEAGLALSAETTAERLWDCAAWGTAAKVTLAVGCGIRASEEHFT